MKTQKKDLQLEIGSTLESNTHLQNRRHLQSRNSFLLVHFKFKIKMFVLCDSDIPSFSQLTNCLN